MKKRVIVVGGGYSGVLAALRLARKTKGQATVTLLTERPTFLERIRLHEFATGKPQHTIHLSHLLRGSGVELKIDTVLKVELQTKGLQCASGERHHYDSLIYAAGSRVDVGAVPGVKEHAFTLELAHLSRFVEAVKQSQRVVVVGAGLTGIEAATELKEAFPSCDVSLVSNGAIGTEYSPRANTFLRAALNRIQVRLMENTRVEAVTDKRLTLSNGSEAFDVCLWAGGFVATNLARDSGFLVNARGQAITNAYLQLDAHPEVFVAGDAAAPQGLAVGALPMGCKTGMPMAAHAADNVAALLAGETPSPFRIRPLLTCISLGRREGLVQYWRGNGRPGVAITGRLGAWLKERVCRFTLNSLHFERMGIAYLWAKGAAPRQSMAGAPETSQ